MGLFGRKRKREKIPPFEQKKRNNDDGKAMKNACLKILKDEGIYQETSNPEVCYLVLWKNKREDCTIRLCKYNKHFFFVLSQTDPDGVVTHFMSEDI